MIRIMSSPSHLDGDEDDQAAVRQPNEPADNSSGDANVEAAKNNVENNNDSIYASCDEGTLTEAAGTSSDEKPSNEALNEQTESTQSE